MKQPLTNARRKAIVKQAIRHAERQALHDDLAFLNALRAHAFAQMPAPRRGRAMATSSATTGAPARRGRGPRLAEDPRYLAAVRGLAQRTKSNARIIGGTTVAGKEFADCVAIGNDSDWGCTGTLIAPNLVLTAGHCESLHSRVFVGNDVEKSGRVIRVVEHVRHPRWDGELHNDLMLLVLEKGVSGVASRKLATSEQIDASSDARVVGFGTTDLAGTTGYGVKQQTDVPIVSPSCRGRVDGRKDSAVYGCHLGKEIVAGKPLLLHDTCRGDSGGPLYVHDQHGGWLLAGVTSRGTDLAKTMCGDGGLYTRVDRYHDWILSVTKKAKKAKGK